MTEKPKPLSPSQARAELQNAAEVPPSRARHPRGVDEWQDFVSQAIEEAMREGAFDNLPGKGKPLNLNENPNEPPDMAMANKILKNNDTTPPWIGDRKKLLEDIESLRAEMAQRWGWMRADWADPNADQERSGPALDGPDRHVDRPDRQTQPSHPGPEPDFAHLAHGVAAYSFDR